MFKGLVTHLRSLSFKSVVYITISIRRHRQDEIPEIILWLRIVDNVLGIYLQMDGAGVTTPSLFKVHEREHHRKIRHKVAPLSHSVIIYEFLTE